MYGSIEMSSFVNAVNKTMGSALSVVWDYGKWMLGYGTDERNDGTGMSCATPFVYTRRRYGCGGKFHLNKTTRGGKSV